MMRCAVLIIRCANRGRELIRPQPVLEVPARVLSSVEPEGFAAQEGDALRPSPLQGGNEAL